ncbi:MAG: 2-amino-4-hydroxy-6-hydroxymethyldihydropteridine diphosphokinase [Gammaproteobacteria bacterium]|nr:2-amino-4-hydroxy-6-hydroxymethyldihydropteridine diphosphokinase [Gammaproteobacteria bacterium]
MPQVFVSVGSNIDRERNIRSGVQCLRALYGPIETSRVYESESVGFDGAPFFNLVVAFDTDSNVKKVIDNLHRIEREHGRVPGTKRFEARTLDLDVLLYGDMVRHEDGVDIPRPEIERYAFVLCPLSELAPRLNHPGKGVTLRECWQNFGDQEQRLRQVEFKWEK